MSYSSTLLLTKPRNGGGAVIAPAATADDLKRVITDQMRDLPTLPLVVAKILQTASSPTASARDLQALIAVDAGLTAKILRLANSSFYGQQRKISTLETAVVILGFSTIRNLTLSASLLDSLQPRGVAQVFDWRAFWEHCNAVALCARLLARQKRLPGSVAESAFVAGLLHDIGKLFLGKYFPDLLAEIVLTAETYGVAHAEAEWRLMGTTHALLGQEIAQHWNFPAELCECIGGHHDPDGYRDDPTLTYLVHAADALTHQAGIGAVSVAPVRLDRDVAEWLNLTSVAREDLLAQLQDEMKNAQSLLGWEAADEPAAVRVAGKDEEIGGDEPDAILHAYSLAIARANTVSEVRIHLFKAAVALADSVWGTALFLWDDEAARFLSGTGDNAVLTRVGEQQMRESLLDAALASTRNAALAAVRAPRALGALAEGHRFLLCPLAGREKTIGFLLLGQSASGGVLAPGPDAARALATLAAHAAAGIVRIHSFLLSVTTLSAAIDARDPGGAGHARRVRDLSVACAERIGLSQTRIETLAVAALVHDVGKLSIPDQILSKPGRLDDDEFRNIASHTTNGAHLAGHAFAALMPLILCHHERWDGTGYPAGLRGTQIPVEAQIIAVAEAWDAMRVGRAYRPALASGEAQREIEGASGAQFSPQVVTAFLSVLSASATTAAAA